MRYGYADKRRNIALPIAIALLFLAAVCFTAFGGLDSSQANYLQNQAGVMVGIYK